MGDSARKADGRRIFTVVEFKRGIVNRRALFSLLGVVAIAGCAGPSVDHPMSRPAELVGPLAGTWQGSFWWVGGVLYLDEGSLRHRRGHRDQARAPPAKAADQVIE